jgi:hypothetical protein
MSSAQHDVKIRFRSFLPGGGFDSSGNPTQGKMRVVGEIDVTAYEGGGGAPLSAQDLGLTTIDSISLRVSDENNGDMSATAGGGQSYIRSVSYTKSVGFFYLFNRDADGQAAVVDNATETLEFDAFGESAHDVELT